MDNEPEAVTTDPTARLGQIREEFNRLEIERERALEEMANQWWEEQKRHDAAKAEAGATSRKKPSVVLSLIA